MWLIKQNRLYTELIWYQESSQNESSDDRKRNFQVESIKRSNSTLWEYALNNEWTHFITITFDSKLIDRYNWEECKKKLTKDFDHFRQRQDENFRYIIKQEPHRTYKKGEKPAIHFHGLIRMSDTSDLIPLKTTEDKYGNIVEVSRSKRFTRKFGLFNEVTKIYNQNEFIITYMTKYMGKNQSIICDEFTKQRFYSSQGLNKSKRYSTDKHIDLLGLVPTYETQYTTVYKMSNEEFNKIKDSMGLKNIRFTDHKSY